MSIKQKYADIPKQTSDISEAFVEKTGILSRHECPDGNILTTLGKWLLFNDSFKLMSSSIFYCFHNFIQIYFLYHGWYKLRTNGKRIVGNFNEGQ